MLAFLILDNKAEQRKVQQVAAEDEKKTQSLEYIEMEELENQDKEKQKELKANKVHIVGAAETIRDILDQTGFSDILEVN